MEQNHFGIQPRPTIAQKVTAPSRYLTARAISEIRDRLRLLFSRVGTPHCLKCGSMIVPQSARQITDHLSAMPFGSDISLFAPATLGQGNSERIIAVLTVPTDDARDEFAIRLYEAVQCTLKDGNGRLTAIVDSHRLNFTSQPICPRCGIASSTLLPSHFNPGSPIGMCHDCFGLGIRLEVDLERLVQNPAVSILDGALRWYGNLRESKDNWHISALTALANHYGIDLERAWQDLPLEFQEVLLYGSGEEKIPRHYLSATGEVRQSSDLALPFRGVVPEISHLFRQPPAATARRGCASYMSQRPCATCRATGISLAAATVTIGGKSIHEVGAMTIAQALTWVARLYDELANTQLEIAGETISEIRDRLQALLDAGLHYLTIDHLHGLTLQ